MLDKFVDFIFNLFRGLLSAKKSDGKRSLYWLIYALLSIFIYIQVIPSRYNPFSPTGYSAYRYYRDGIDVGVATVLMIIYAILSYFFSKNMKNIFEDTAGWVWFRFVCWLPFVILFVIYGYYAFNYL